MSALDADLLSTILTLFCLALIAGGALIAGHTSPAEHLSDAFHKASEPRQ